MAKAPWFKFWAADYMASPFVQSLEPEQEFWYLRLIVASALANPRGCLPLASSKQYLLARAKSQKHFEKHSSEILAKFEKDEAAGFYVVAKIANQLIAHDDISQKRAQSGKKGGLAKQQKRDLAIATNLPQQLPTDSDSDSDSDIKPSSELKGSSDQSTLSQKRLRERPSQEAYRLAGLLKAEILRNKADYRITQQQERSWSVTAQRMIDSDKREPEAIADVIRWVQHDEFWHANVLSMAKVREKFDQLSLRKEQSPSRKSVAASIPPPPASETILRELSARAGAR